MGYSHAQIHIERAREVDRADGNGYSFAWIILDVRWPLLFFSETDFINNYLHFVQKWTKNQCVKLQNFQDFCPRDMESCKARETMVSKAGSH